MKYIYLSTLIVFSIICFGQSGSKFKIVLDAGHGGKDPGTMRGNIREKDIALDVVLKIGSILEQNEDISVVYTRKTDVFIELIDRAKIANKAKANLFISVHCNGVKSLSAKGTETFVMGMSRTDKNLDIAKKENGVIFLEDNYKQKYNGFDPNNPETLLGLKILQEEFLNQSIELATEVENNFINNNKRFSRGVKQQPIWVLDATVMPGVLIELGFVSHPEESQYLISEEGKIEMSKSISDAVLTYKNNFFNANESVEINSNLSTNSNDSNESTTNKKEIVYKVQLEAGTKKIDLKSSNFKGLKNVSYTFENKIYKYFYGNENDYKNCEILLKEAKRKGYKTAYIVTVEK